MAFLARELQAFGAPPALLARLKQAARDEIAHAERMRDLARARGAEPPPAVERIDGARGVVARRRWPRSGERPPAEAERDRGQTHADDAP